MKPVAGHQHHAADPGRCRRRRSTSSPRAPRAPPPRRQAQALRDGQPTACRDRAGRDRESGASAASRSARPGIRIFRGDARHGDRALGERRHPVTPDVVGGDDRLPPTDQDAQADIVAFRALRLFDRAVAHVDAERDRAQRNGVSGVGAGRGALLRPAVRPAWSGRIGRAGRSLQNGCKGAAGAWQGNNSPERGKTPSTLNCKGPPLRPVNQGY